MEGILGRKVGMTQIFVADGTAIPVTVIKAGPCLVVQSKTADNDGYEAVQIGLVEEKPAKPNQPQAGHFKKAGVAPMRQLEEFRLDAGEELKAGRRGQGLDVQREGLRGRRRHQQGQGLPGRHEAPRLRAAAAARTARCSTARRARSARRPIPPASSRACG